MRAGASQREVGRDLGVSKSTLSKWCAEADRKDQGLPAVSDVSPAENARVREVMRRNKLLEQENEVQQGATMHTGALQHICRRFISHPQNDLPSLIVRWLRRVP